MNLYRGVKNNEAGGLVLWLKNQKNKLLGGSFAPVGDMNQLRQVWCSTSSPWFVVSTTYLLCPSESLARVALIFLLRKYQRPSISCDRLEETILKGFPKLGNR
jgi:hypothetical protein